MQPLFEHRLRIDGYETRVLELEGDGPSLILFHGYGDSADTWRPLMDHFARVGRRAVVTVLGGAVTGVRTHARPPGSTSPRHEPVSAGWLSMNSLKLRRSFLTA